MRGRALFGPPFPKAEVGGFIRHRSPASGLIRSAAELADVHLVDRLVFGVFRLELVIGVVFGWIVFERFAVFVEVGEGDDVAMDFRVVDVGLGVGGEGI